MSCAIITRSPDFPNFACNCLINAAGTGLRVRRWDARRVPGASGTGLGLAFHGFASQFSSWGTRAGLAALPEALPRANDIRLDWHVLLFTLIVSVLASLVFGLAPALQISRADLNETLKKGEKGAGASHPGVQGAFVAGDGANGCAPDWRRPHDSQPCVSLER
jgi:hypothetical protein